MLPFPYNTINNEIFSQHNSQWKIFCYFSYGQFLFIMIEQRYSPNKVLPCHLQHFLYHSTIKYEILCEDAQNKPQQNNISSRLWGILNRKLMDTLRKYTMKILSCMCIQTIHGWDLYIYMDMERQFVYCIVRIYTSVYNLKIWEKRFSLSMCTIYNRYRHYLYKKLTDFSLFCV